MWQWWEEKGELILRDPLPINHRQPEDRMRMDRGQKRGEVILSNDATIQKGYERCWFTFGERKRGIKLTEHSTQSISPIHITIIDIIEPIEGRGSKNSVKSSHSFEKKNENELTCIHRMYYLYTCDHYFFLFLSWHVIQMFVFLWNWLFGDIITSDPSSSCTPPTVRQIAG